MSKPLRPKSTGRYRPGFVALERALSKLGLASRTVAREWILAGKVKVDDRVVRDPKWAVVPERAEIEITGPETGTDTETGTDPENRSRKPLTDTRYLNSNPFRPLTIALHKPKGYVSTRSDEKGRPTVYSLIKAIDQHLGLVGRLDYATTGLLLFTNDTKFANWLTDPTNAIRRVYLVTVRGEVTEADARRWQAGIQDEGERLGAARVEVRKASRRESHLTIELTEGKNREIRRMCKALGFEVTRLKRVAFGGLELGDLEPGKWRELSREEIEQAFPNAVFRS
jgi:23S rRNA pseudouridine2605 synthase